MMADLGSGLRQLLQSLGASGAQAAQAGDVKAIDASNTGTKRRTNGATQGMRCTPQT